MDNKRFRFGDLFGFLGKQIEFAAEHFSDAELAKIESRNKPTPVEVQVLAPSPTPVLKSEADINYTPAIIAGIVIIGFIIYRK